MDDYSEKICEACSIDAPVASDSSVSEFLKNHTEWKWADDREFPQIVRVYKFSRYLLGLNFQIWNFDFSTPSHCFSWIISGLHVY